MQILGLAIIIIFILAALLVYFTRNDKPSMDKLEKQKEAYEELLKKYNVPKEHYKIVIGQSRVYSVYNCPALIWKEKGKVKMLVMRLNPVLDEQEESDFLFLASQPYVDFKRFDNSEFPDWAVQSDYVKELFLPYVNLSKTVGGIDYKQQMYWIGTICLYAKSLAQVLTMLDRPLLDYENRVDNKGLMLRDGALPEKMKEELQEARELSKEMAPFVNQEMGQEASALQDMEKAIQIIRDAERKAGEEAATERINQLYARLLTQKRYEELERATKDEAYRKELLKEIG